MHITEVTPTQLLLSLGIYMINNVWKYIHSEQYEFHPLYFAVKQQNHQRVKHSTRVLIIM